MTQNTAAAFDWVPFYNMVANSGASKLLTEALSIINKDVSATTPGYAVDLGCGEGRDTVELLRLGWKVLAIDNTAEGIKRLLANSQAKGNKSLETRVASFANETWSGANLVVALLALPYCPPADFPQVWKTICNSLVPGGYVCVQFFGDQHQWAQQSFITSFTKQQVIDLFDDYSFRKFEERQTTGTGADGSTVTVHDFNIIAKHN